MRVAVTGGEGRLGKAVIARLRAQSNVEIISLDLSASTYKGCSGVRAVQLDLRQCGELAGQLSGVDVVVHLAAKHGAHIAAGLSELECWSANVDVTATVLAAATCTGVQRLVYVSSTSVFGSGSEVGVARVLDEGVRAAPEDLYDRAKLRCERMVFSDRHLFKNNAVVLRMGRFDHPDELSHETRKLSTGLDIRDAACAIQLAVAVKTFPHFLYCVASDIPLSVADRQSLGHDLNDTVRRCMPTLSQLSCRGRIKLPNRVGKSVSSSLLAADLGWSPVHTIEAWAKERIVEADAV
jgi:UDP-glucose 4-epimerase